jgi:hypothetical protein
MSRWFLFTLLLLVSTLAPLRAQQLVPMSSPADASEKMEIEAPVPLPEHINWRLPAAGAGLLIVAGLTVFFLWKKKGITLPPSLLPHETALLRLTEADTFAATEHCAAFAELFDQTLRRYLEERFGLAASKQTVSELISGIEAGGETVPELLRNSAAELKTWLQLCEDVKFAAASLSREHMSGLSISLRTFIETTKAETAQ